MQRNEPCPICPAAAELEEAAAALDEIACDLEAEAARLDNLAAWDGFATAALAALLPLSENQKLQNMDFRDWAGLAASYADALLEERKARQ